MTIESTSEQKIADEQNRLTKRIDDHVYYTMGAYSETLPAECTSQDVRHILKRLADYEDVEEAKGLKAKLGYAEWERDEWKRGYESLETKFNQAVEVISNTIKDIEYQVLQADPHPALLGIVATVNTFKKVLSSLSQEATKCLKCGSVRIIHHPSDDKIFLCADCNYVSQEGKTKEDNA